MMRCTLFSGWFSVRPSEVHLHAVPEPAQALVADAVPLDADAVPQVGHRPQLADLVDEPDACVHEERDRAEHSGETVGLDLTGAAHRIEHPDRRGQGVGDLLHGVAPASCRW